jgi:uncharacterized protein with PIN domain
MCKAIFTFHEDLNDFLPLNQRGASLDRRFKGPVSVKHLIEALGVPHTEVQSILANGEPVGHSYLVESGDEIDVYPFTGNPDFVSSNTGLPAPPKPYRFVLDNHLGRLAAYLRLLGFDTVYDSGLDDAELAVVSHQEERILLTRDRGLLMRRLVTYGYCVRTRQPKEQLQAVVARFALADQIRPWQRCLRCNGRLVPVTKKSVLHLLQPKTIIYYNEFHRCRSCEQVYWKGSHYQRMQQFLSELDFKTA